MPSIALTCALRTASLALAALAAMAHVAWAQAEANYPDQANPASSSASRPAAATICSPGWSGRSSPRSSGNRSMIENKAGAGGRLAVEFVKNQPADGYTRAWSARAVRWRSRRRSIRSSPIIRPATSSR